MNATGWSRGLEVTGGGDRVVSHAGLALLHSCRTGRPDGGVVAGGEDGIRTGRDSGFGHFPSHDSAVNTAWLTACTLLAWLKLVALDGDLAKAEPKTLRYRILHSSACLACGGR